MKNKYWNKNYAKVSCPSSHNSNSGIFSCIHYGISNRPYKNTYTQIKKQPIYLIVFILSTNKNPYQENNHSCKQWGNTITVDMKIVNQTYSLLANVMFFATYSSSPQKGLQSFRYHHVLPDIKKNPHV